MRSYIKVNDPTNRSSFVNSNSCFSSPLAVPIFLASTNSRVTRKTKFQCKSNVIIRSEKVNSLVDRKLDNYPKGKQ